MYVSYGIRDGDGARYWRQIYWLIGVTEEIKSPCGDRSFAFWLNLILQSRHLTRVHTIDTSEGIFLCTEPALFRGIGWVAWAGASTILIKFIIFGGAMVAFVANITIVALASRNTPGCIRPKGNQSSSQHKSFQFHRGKVISTTSNHCLSVCHPSNEGGAACASNGAELL